MAQVRREERVWEGGLDMPASLIRVIRGLVREIARRIGFRAATGGCWTRAPFALVRGKATSQGPVFAIGTTRTPKITLCNDSDEAGGVKRGKDGQEQMKTTTKETKASGQFLRAQ